ncbi:MAG TPA: LemA family protein [bacterium]|nr:LemA family protein [bacterium]HOX85697.1 LemA family protein [bacterium]HPG44856.1 LemA family protein [bacterium]HPM98115.1 LemA family protein [bacterium]
MAKKLSTGCLVTAGVLIVLALILFSFFKGTYNRLVDVDESVNNAWAQVENQLQRRMDLIPNLVETVKGYANFERETLEAVINARASATQTTLNADQLAQDPAMMEQFMQAQNNLGSALSRLMVVVERYPELKANENFRTLMDQLEGTENRIAVERKRYNDTVQTYSKTIRAFPTVVIAGLLGFGQRPYFEAPEEANQAPKVDFGASEK